MALQWVEEVTPLTTVICSDSQAIEAQRGLYSIENEIQSIAFTFTFHHAL